MKGKQEINGFPVLTRQYGADGAVESEATLKGAREADLDVADFAPPEKYNRRDLAKQIGR